MRCVKYGCSQTRSRSPAPSGPRLSQIVLETPRRPKSCDESRAAERADVGFRQSEIDAGLGGQIAPPRANGRAK